VGELPNDFPCANADEQMIRDILRHTLGSIKQQQQQVASVWLAERSTTTSDYKLVQGRIHNDAGDIHPGTTNYQVLVKAADSCALIGMKNANIDQCKNFYNNCLENKDSSTCNTFWRNARFWGTQGNELKKMHPGVAKTMLDKFGLRSPGGEYESVADWISRISPDNVKTAIQNNAKLISYINGLRNLTHKFFPGNGKQMGKHFVGSRLAAIGVPSIGNDVRPLVIRTRQYVGGILANVKSVVNSLFVPATGFVIGGGSVSLEHVAGTAHQFKRKFDNFVLRLESNGKTFGQKDRANIDKIIEEMIEAENKVDQLTGLIKKYESLRELMPNAESLLTLDGMQKFVSARKKKAEKYLKLVTAFGPILVATAQSIDDAE